MMFQSRPVGHLSPGLLPLHYDSWGVPTRKYVEQATFERPVYLSSDHPHVLTEGIA